MTDPDKARDRSPLHVVVASLCDYAVEEALRDSAVVTINPAKQTGKTRSGDFQIVRHDGPISIDSLQATSFSVHWTALRDLQPARLAMIRAHFAARQIPEADFLSRPATKGIPADLALDPRVVDLVSVARERAGDDLLLTYSLLVNATAQVLMQRGGDQWEALTDLEIALDRIRDAQDARSRAPVHF